MGFRSNTYATVWSVEPKSDSVTRARISISRKNKQTNEYEQDFSDYVSFIGTATASKALRLKERDRIKIGECDVRTYFNKETRRTYYNFNIYGFEMADNSNLSNGAQPSATPEPVIDDSDVNDLPF